MILNTDTGNLTETWDLEPDEYSLYRGAGRAAVVIGTDNKLLAVVYLDKAPPSKVASQLASVAQEYPMASRWQGMMSAYQFCSFEP